MTRPNSASATPSVICPAVVIGAVPPATGEGQYVDGTPLSAQKSSLSTVSNGCLSGVTGWLYMTKYGFSRSAWLAAADLAGHPPHGLDGLDAAGRHHQRLGGGGDHGAELPRVRLAGVHAVGVGARHDEVDLGQRVAEAGRLGDVLEPAEAALAGLEVVQVHDVGAVAEVGATGRRGPSPARRRGRRPRSSPAPTRAPARRGRRGRGRGRPRPWCSRRRA